MLTDKEIDQRLKKANKPQDFVKIYIDVFDEDIPTTSETWGEVPVELIIDAILDKKPIAKEKLYEQGKIVL